MDQPLRWKRKSLVLTGTVNILVQFHRPRFTIHAGQYHSELHVKEKLRTHRRASPTQLLANMNATSTKAAIYPRSIPFNTRIAWNPCRAGQSTTVTALMILASGRDYLDLITLLNQWVNLTLGGLKVLGEV